MRSSRGRFPWKAVFGAGAVLGVLGIGAVAFANRRRVEPKLPSKRVALIGDSYAVGLDPELAKFITNFRSEGFESTRTDQWATHSPACGQCGDWLTTFKPDVVLVSLGVNDGATPNPSNYQTIVKGLHGLGARVIWIEPPAAVRTPSRSIIASLGVTTVPATSTPLTGDGIHPQSYAPWAREIAATLVALKFLGVQRGA